MNFYAIYDRQSGLYVTRGLSPKLDELGIDTKFFSTRSEAMRFIEMPVHRDYQTGDGVTALQNSLAWWLLEKVYGKDRWHIDCNLAEYEDAAKEFKGLMVRTICVLEGNAAK